MSAVTRGVKNAFRNPLRGVAVVVILAISIGLAVTMLLARQAVTEKANVLTAEVATGISISPAGSFGFEGGGEPLTSSQLKNVQALQNVVKATATLSDRLIPDSTTSLQPGMDPGSLGNRRLRQESRSGGSVSESTEGAPNTAGGALPQNFKLPVQVTGTSESGLPLGATLQSGEDFLAGSSDAVALMGTQLATKNNLTIGNTFTMYGQTVTVKGIYSAGNQFSDTGVIVPLTFLQQASEQVDQISSIQVTAESAEVVSAVSTSLKTLLGSAADVTANIDQAEATISPLRSIQRIATVSALGALLAASIITFFSMAMVVRERRKEIGVLKAIGAGNFTVIGQFVAEAVILVLVAAFVGTILGAVLGNPVLHSLLQSETQASISQTGPGGLRTAFRPENFSAGATIQSVRSLTATVGANLLGFGALAAVLVAALGSAIPAWLTARVRPAEVLRGE